MGHSPPGQHIPKATSPWPGPDKGGWCGLQCARAEPSRRCPGRFPILPETWKDGGFSGPGSRVPMAPGTQYHRGACAVSPQGLCAPGTTQVPLTRLGQGAATQLSPGPPEQKMGVKGGGWRWRGEAGAPGVLREGVREGTPQGETSPMLGSCPRQGLWVRQRSGQWSVPAVPGQTARVGGSRGPLVWVMLAAPGLFLTLSLLSCLGGCCCRGGRAVLLPRLLCPSPEGLNFYPSFRPTFNPQLLANSALAKLGKMHPLPMSGAGLLLGS